ncbi:MAG: hypothetical protein AAB260_00075, partial [Planctomycetota bacterium]
VVVLTAAYLLWMFWRVMCGPAPERTRTWYDLSFMETVTLTLPAILVVLIGVYPKILLDRIEPSASALLVRAEKKLALNQTCPRAERRDGSGLAQKEMLKKQTVIAVSRSPERSEGEAKQ